MTTCPGCGASFEEGDFAPQRYGVASPECWQAFNIMLAKENMNFGYPDVHRLVVDAYAVQHPQNFELQKKLGITKRFVEASIQSVAIHLIALYFALEEDQPLADIRHLMNQIIAVGAEFHPLEVPKSLGNLTILDAPGMQDFTAYEKFAWDWGETTWEAWAHAHGQVKEWILQYLR